MVEYCYYAFNSNSRLWYVIWLVNIIRECMCLIDNIVTDGKSFDIWHLYKAFLWSIITCPGTFHWPKMELWHVCNMLVYYPTNNYADAAINKTYIIIIRLNWLLVWWLSLRHYDYSIFLLFIKPYPNNTGVSHVL